MSDWPVVLISSGTAAAVGIAGIAAAFWTNHLQRKRDLADVRASQERKDADCRVAAKRERDRETRAAIEECIDLAFAALESAVAGDIPPGSRVTTLRSRLFARIDGTDVQTVDAFRRLVVATAEVRKLALRGSKPGEFDELRTEIMSAMELLQIRMNEMDVPW